jgi:hypothetical protein
VEVTPFQIEQVMNISGFGNNFRPPMPFYGRVVQDGSLIVNSSLTWAVKVCCIDSDDMLTMTSSVSKVLGFAVEDIEINHFSVNVDMSMNIEYLLTVIENTETFLKRLLQNINNKDYMKNIKDQIKADLKKSEVNTFDSVLVKIDNMDSLPPWHYPHNVTEWGKVAEICEYGKMQSPIDLPTHPGFKQNELNTTSGVTSNLTASHGHSLKWSLDTQKRPTLYLSGLKYDLLQ